MQARPKFRMTRKLQLPPTAGPSRYWLGPKMWLLRSTGWSATTSDKPPRIACTHIGGTTWWLHMSAAKLKLALSSRSRFCTLTFTVSLRFAAAMGQVFSIKFTWKQSLSLNSARTSASLKQYPPWQSQSAKVEGSCHLVHVCGRFASQFHLSLEFCPNFWADFSRGSNLSSCRSRNHVGRSVWGAQEAHFFLSLHSKWWPSEWQQTTQVSPCPIYVLSSHTESLSGFRLRMAKQRSKNVRLENSAQNQKTWGTLEANNSEKNWQWLFSLFPWPSSMLKKRLLYPPIFSHSLLSGNSLLHRNLFNW